MKIKWKTPKDWNHLSEKQLIQLAKIPQSKGGALKIDIKILAILLNLRWWQFLKQYRFKKAISYFSIAALKKHYAFIYQQCSRTNFVSLRKWYLPKKKQYTAPANRLSNISIEEFSVAEDLIKHYYQTKELDYLKYLTAVLYVKGPLVKRPIFDKENLKNNTLQLPYLSKNKLLAISMCYLGCREHIQAKYPKTFPKTKAKSKGADKGFNPVIRQMAGAKFGAFNETRNTNMYVFLDEYEENLNQLEHADY